MDRILVPAFFFPQVFEDSCRIQQLDPSKFRMFPAIS
jgi:hypothetical protein